MKIGIKRKQLLLVETEIVIEQLELFLNNPEEILDDGDYITGVLERLQKIHKYIQSIK